REMRPTEGPNHNPGIREGLASLRAIGLVAAALLLLPTPALAAEDLATEQFLVLFAVATGAVSLAISAALWALSEQKAAGKLRRILRITGARVRAAIGERDALLASGRDALVVWGRDDSAPLSYAGGETVLDSCLAGTQAKELSAALDDLSENGAGFTLAVHDKNARPFTVRGRAVGGMAAVWMEPVHAAAVTRPTHFREILDLLPLPVWVRDARLDR